MDVVVWLRSLGLGKYEAVFRENDIDETVLPNLTVVLSCGRSFLGGCAVHDLLDFWRAIRNDIGMTDVAIENDTLPDA